MKDPKCTICGGAHYKTFCLQAANKPIKRTAIKKTFSKPRKKKTPRAKAKEEAWKAFSDYIRTRDSLATTGTTTFCICITCNERGDSEPKPYAHIQGGHAVGGRSNAILFHEEIVNGQCDYCNQKPPYGLGGDYGNYAIALIKKYGLEHVEQLQRLKGVEKQYKTYELEEITQTYRYKLNDLLQNA